MDFGRDYETRFFFPAALSESCRDISGRKGAARMQAVSR